MRRLALTCLALMTFAAVAIHAAPVSAEAIVSYGFSSSTGPPITPTGAGVLGVGPTDQWMVEGGTGDPIPDNTTTLTDVNGDLTPYSFSHSGFSAHAGGNAPDSSAGIGPFVNSWFGKDDASTHSYTFGGFDPNDVVDLVFFANYHFPSSGPGSFIRGTNFTIGSTTMGTTGQGSTPTAYDEGTNYVQFDNVIVDASGMVNVAVEGADANNFPDVNGFQLSAGGVTASIDRVSGMLTLGGVGNSVDSILGYSLRSAVGALDQSAWNSIANTGDADSGGSIDPDDTWTVLTEAGVKTDLSELQVAGPGPQNGFGLAGGSSINLGDVWIQNPHEDVEIEVILPSGALTPFAVEFTGNDGAPFAVGDLDFDRDVDEQDWIIYLAGAKADMSAFSSAEAYQRGDLTGDGVNDLEDLDRFINIFESANGAGSFAEMVASVPEPSSVCILVIGLLVGGGRTFRRNTRPTRSSKGVASRKPARLAFDLRVATVGLWCLLGVVGVSQGADFFSEDFSDNSPGPNMALGADFGSPTFNFDNDWTITSGNGSRIYLGTSDTNYSQLDFTFEAEVTTPNFTDWSNVFFGMGNPDADSAALGEPVTGPHVIGTMWPGRSPARVTSKDNAIHSTASTLEDFVPDLFGGTHLMRMSWDSTNGLALFEIDVANDGEIDSVFTIDGSDNGFDSTNSQLVVGGGAGMSVDNISVTGTPRLTLEVDSVTGMVHISNPTTSPIEISGYEIDSPGGALDLIEWNSFADQNLDPVDGPDADSIVGNGNGETWLESASSRKEGLLEGFLLGGTVIPPSGTQTLGNAFDVSVFGSGTDGDLAFRYRTVDRQLLPGFVEYVPTILEGDYNGNGVVDAADYTVWRDTLGSTIDRRADGDDSGVVDEADYLYWKSRFGNSVAGTMLATSMTVPEPSSLATLLAICLGSVVTIRRRKDQRICGSSENDRPGENRFASACGDRRGTTCSGNRFSPSLRDMTAAV